MEIHTDTFEETMGNTPSFNDAFARRAASGAQELGRKPDRLKPQPKPQSPKLGARSPSTGDAFAPKPEPAKPAGLGPPGKAAAKSAQKAHAFADAFRPAPKAVKPVKLAPLAPARPVPKSELIAKAGQAKPTARPTMIRPKVAAAKTAALTPVVQKAKPAFAKAPPKASPARPPEKPPADPFFDTPAVPLEAEPARAPLHVVASQPSPVHRNLQILKGRPAAVSSSLVLVSGAGAMTASNADVLDKPAPPAPPPAEPPAAVTPPPATTTPPPEASKTGGGSGGGSGSGGSGAGNGSGAAVVQAKRGFNQDDLFGVVFGILVILFLLLWFMRGRGDVVPQEPDALVSPQSASSAAAPPPAATLVDPFAGAPIDLRPKGDIPEQLSDEGVAAATPTDPPVTPQEIPPPAVAAVPPPVTALQPEVPLAERRLNAWFCTASSTITTASRKAIDVELEKFASVFEGKELVVRGYADTRGATEFNSALGGERARVVADFLRTKGLTVAEFSGVGELEGLDDNQNCSNQRRVDVWVKGGPAEEPSRACAPEPEREALVCGR